MFNPCLFLRKVDRVLVAQYCEWITGRTVAGLFIAKYGPWIVSFLDIGEGLFVVPESQVHKS